MAMITKRRVREALAASKDAVTKFDTVDLTGEPYATDALAFLKQAGVMLEKQLVVMGGGTATPTAAEEKK